MWWCNFDPARLPGFAVSEEAEGEVYRHNAWLDSTYEGLDAGAPVALIGSGLTAVDVLLRLRELGHTGVITTVSRRGIFPSRHILAEEQGDPVAAIPAGTRPTCRAYLRAFRMALGEGTDWRAAMDSLRSTTNDLWLALPLREQKRFRRHLQRRWDVMRHRMAPLIANCIEGEVRAGTLVVREGNPLGLETGVGAARLKIRTRQGIEDIETVRVIICTGPSMDYPKVGSQLLESLFADGVAVAGPMGLGLLCSREGALIDSEGRESESLFNAGARADQPVVV